MAAWQVMAVQVNQHTKHLCLSFLMKLDFLLSLHVRKRSTCYQMLLAARQVSMHFTVDSRRLLISWFCRHLGIKVSKRQGKAYTLLHLNTLEMEGFGHGQLQCI